MAVPEISLHLLKALADRTRLGIVQALVEAPRCVEELAAALALSAPTISHHLKKLETAGVVAGRKEQYYVVYSLRPEMLQRRLIDLAAAAPDAPPVTDKRMAAHRQKVLDTFFRDGRLRHLPAQRKKRLVALAAFAADFALGLDYPEAEVDRIIAVRWADYCTVRRELVDAGLLARERRSDRMIYRRTGDVDVAPLPAPQDEPEAPRAPDKAERKRRIALYKEAKRRAGVYGIRNLESGRLLLGSSLNLQGPLNRHRAELGFGSHRCRRLQEDWNRLGPDAFEFAILDTVDRKLEGRERDAALRKLEEEWVAHFRPFADKCYNGSESIRTKAF